MKVWDRARIELTTPGSAVRHVTDCATRPGPTGFYHRYNEVFFLGRPRQVKHALGAREGRLSEMVPLEHPGHVFKLKNKKITILYVKVRNYSANFYWFHFLFAIN